MTLIEFIVFVVVAGLCAAVAGSVLGVRAGGILAAIAVGFIGAFVGTWLARQLALPELIVIQGIPVVWTIVGSVVVLALVALLRRGTKET